MGYTRYLIHREEYNKKYGRDEMSNYLGLTRHQLENEIDERDDELSRLRAELEAYIVKVGTIGYGNYTGNGSDLDEAQHSVFVVRRAFDELEATKPKPVVIIREVEIKATPEGGTYFGWSPSNVRFTFHDGKLVSAEVIGEKK